MDSLGQILYTAVTNELRLQCFERPMYCLQVTHGCYSTLDPKQNDSRVNYQLCSLWHGLSYLFPFLQVGITSHRVPTIVVHD
jgi:hypothetical protein